MQKIIGITGGIACGKTNASNIIKTKYPVIDCDKITHQMWESNEQAYKLVLKEFGPSILTDGKIDRKKLGNLVFNDEFKLERLNQIVHPIIIETVFEEISKIKEDFVFIDAPLLFETNLDKKCDYVICVYVSYDIQINRLMNRNNLSKDEAIKRISLQMPLEEKKNKSDFLLDTSGSFKSTKDKLLKILKEVEQCR